MDELAIIENKIYEIRGQKVMLDFDLAEMYGVTTSALNQSVKRNAQRFPEEFMFRISKTEWENMSSQFVTTSRTKRPKTSFPYWFRHYNHKTIKRFRLSRCLTPVRLAGALTTRHGGTKPKITRIINARCWRTCRHTES